MAISKPRIAIIGGSGLYALPELRQVRPVRPRTRFGPPSAPIAVGMLRGVQVAFLPRHGKNHELPPHRIPYQANIAALSALGVTRIFATCIVGSLRRSLHPGDLVVPDQLVNLAINRPATLAERSIIHLPFSEPYCPSMRTILIGAAKRLAFPLHRRGTVVVIPGPRFSTRAESGWYMTQGWDIVNMTQSPEAYLAREAGMCYAAIAGITDYDVGIRSRHNFEPSQVTRVVKTFWINVELSKRVVAAAAAGAAIRRAACPTCSRTANRLYFQSVH